MSRPLMILKLFKIFNTVKNDSICQHSTLIEYIFKYHFYLFVCTIICNCIVSGTYVNALSQELAINNISAKLDCILNNAKPINSNVEGFAISQKKKLFAQNK
jgi:hypothetical protein